jgi:hypothetical protein
LLGKNATIQIETRSTMLRNKMIYFNTNITFNHYFAEGDFAISMEFAQK